MAAPSCSLCPQPSEYSCSCQYPPIATCINCRSAHEQTSGNHVWAPLDQVEKPNAFCKICQHSPSEIVCCCDIPPPLLCKQCRGAHIDKKVAIHLEQPVKKAEKVRSWDDIEKARRVVENRDRIAEYLSKNLGETKRLKEDAISFAEKVVAQVTSARDEIVKEIINIETRIEEKRLKVMQEIEEYLFEPEVKCRELLAKEAFNASKKFVCTEILRGEISIGESADFRLANLHIPPLLTEAGIGQSQVPYPISQYLSLQMDEVAKSVQSLSLPDAGEKLLSIQSLPKKCLEVTEEMKTCVHAPCREDFREKTQEIPLTIGRHRLPIRALLSEFAKNESLMRKIQVLGEKYSSWRRSRGDGNCFYRCVGVLLCEHYCRPSTPRQEFFTAYNLMRDQNQPFQLTNANQDVMRNVKLWLRLLKDLHQARLQGDNALQKLQYFLQKPQFDTAVIVAMRQYTANFCELHADDSDISPFLIEGRDPLIREISENGKEAEGIALKFTSQALSVILHIVIVDRKLGQFSEVEYGPNSAGRYPAMHLLHHPGHYNYLVPKAWDDADRYDFPSNSYSPTATERAVDCEDYTPS